MFSRRENDIMIMMIKNPIKEPMTTIQVSRETQGRLSKLGGKGDTYDEIIKRLLGKAERKLR